MSAIKKELKLVGYAVLIVLGFALLVFFTLVIRQKDVYDEAANSEAQARLATLRELREREEQALTTTAWIDRNAGKVQIPVELAMKLEVENLRKKPVRKSTEKKP